MRAAQLRAIAAKQSRLLRTMRTATPSPARVTSVYCQRCRKWRKPSKFHPFADTCRSCPGGGPVLLDEPRAVRA